MALRVNSVRAEEDELLTKADQDGPKDPATSPAAPRTAPGGCRPSRSSGSAVRSTTSRSCLLREDGLQDVHRRRRNRCTSPDLAAIARWERFPARHDRDFSTAGSAVVADIAGHHIDEEEVGEFEWSFATPGRAVATAPPGWISAVSATPVTSLGGVTTRVRQSAPRSELRVGVGGPRPAGGSRVGDAAKLVLATSTATASTGDEAPR